jgi:capsular polysaccharide export protein
MVHRVNFRVGDKLSWRGPVTDFRGRLADLPKFYDDLLRRHHVTDVLLFGDMRPVHLPVHPAAQKHGARVHVFEEGYIRPNWITVEREGVNLNSPLPKNPNWYRAAAKLLPAESEAEDVHVPIARRAAQDLAYRLSSSLDPLFFPRYRTHRPRRAFMEYAGWAARYARFPFYSGRDTQALRRVTQATGPLFLLPLQLNGDSQILHHSPFASVADVIRDVVASFAAHAPSDAQLIVKNHPLDPGLDGHRAVTARAARTRSVGDRVHFLETTNLAQIFPNLSGVVLVNSTTGLSAIWRGIPVYALAEPIYKMRGLTSGGSLHEFWSHQEKPDLDLYHAFRRVLLHVNHVNGDYFTPEGIRLAVQGCARMFANPSPLDKLLAAVPLQSLA